MNNFNLPKIPNLTGDRIRRMADILKNAPRDPKCGCLILSETARLMIAELFREEEAETEGRVQ